ncbi:MAG: NACHT domain-containing protein [Dactylosporangium sp.]|nr:HEAT repeat domain-containing protein [Dactylosporangium sp.]NNJ61117.1 NACHT domain-containing protein [Dactylosporangium sp.]
MNFRMGSGSGDIEQDGDGTRFANTGTVNVQLVLASPAVRQRLGEERVREYLKRLVQHYGCLDLEIITPKEQDEHRRLQLRSVFVAQHVRSELPALELPRDLLRQLVGKGELDTRDLPDCVDQERLRHHRDAFLTQPSAPVFQVLTDVRHRLVVLLGDPGAGKSSLARYVSLTLAGEGDNAALHGLAGWLPLLIELRSFAESQWRSASFLDFLAHLHATDGLGLPKGELDDFLTADGRAVVFFDGLDELFDPATRVQVTRQIANFASHYPKVRIVTTSRVIGYRKTLLEEAGFAHFTIQDLDREQIEQFSARWYELACSDDPVEADRRRGRLLAAVDASASLRELAGNPLLLTILSIIGRRQELPRDRRRVYGHAADVLVERWDFERHLRDAKIADYIDQEDKVELLQRVARQMQDSRTGLAGNHIEGRTLTREFQAYLQERYQVSPCEAKPIANAMLAQFRERNFILSHFGGDIYGFVHRAFLEYFSASDIVHRFQDEQTLSLDELMVDVYGRRWSDPAWQEVLLLISGMINERFVGQAIDRLVEMNPLWFFNSTDPPRHILLAVRCFGEVRRIGVLTAQGQRILLAIIDALELTRNLFDPRSVRLVADSIRQFALPTLTAVGSQWPGRSRFLDWFKTTTRLSVASRFLGADPALSVAVQIVAALFPEDEDVHALLLAPAVFDLRGDIGKAAVQAIATGWRDREDTLPWLRDRATNDPHWATRQAAVQAIATGWRDQDDTLPLLRDRATNDPHEDVRQEAVQLLRHVESRAGG